ncbi:hypothetical protein MG293_004480 [Ovis ammon polii]|uniref:Uncharacterized protein n=1 Tax=Ovis ammon polii TaxID=230172 RepID=A0AAD4UGD6_OVIAM|nr:hypothetical protein MG293_004480 [Ovis ammon polii]
MTLLDSGLRAAAAAAGPRVPPSSLRLRLPPRATTMSEFLLALLTLSGLLPVAKVLTVGADREEGMKSSEDFATHPNKYGDCEECLVDMISFSHIGVNVVE